MWKSIFFIFISIAAEAAPESLEIWFISNAKRAQIHQLIKDSEFRFFRPLAALECQEMGDFCFDPQFGLYKKGEEGAQVDTEKVVHESQKVIPSASSVDRELINCDPTNRFDIFCGKAKANPNFNKSKFEIWIDTSSSMREVDYTDKDGTCYRKRMIDRLDKTCPFNQKVNVMMFDTSIKQAGTIESLCVNQGLNDYKKLIDWIERSDAKKLIVITDIYEFHKEFADYVESKHGKFRGDKDALTAEQMFNLADELAKACK
jgi:hypothetical protein